MGWTKGNRWTRRKKWTTVRHLKQKERLLVRRLRTNNFSYPVSMETYSKVKCKMHELGLTKELPGRDALKEVYTFLISHGRQHYELALESALHKTKGRRYKDEKERERIIRNLEDVRQVIRESVRTARIYEITVKDFIYESLPK